MAENSSNTDCLSSEDGLEMYYFRHICSCVVILKLLSQPEISLILIILLIIKNVFLSSMMSATIHGIVEILLGQHSTKNTLIFLLCMGIHSYLSTKCAVVVTGSSKAMTFMPLIENFLGKNSP